jgi:hypothetical protein
MAGLHETRLVRRDDGLHAVSQAELGEQARDVRLHRRVLDYQLPGDLGVRESAGEQAEHLALRAVSSSSPMGARSAGRRA